MPAFFEADCNLFGRYPNSVPWSQVEVNDQKHFKTIRERLKEITKTLSNNKPNFQSATSLYVPNGRTAPNIWSCIYPESVPNKSYGLQVALIISSRGGELCFCMGAGRAQINNNEKRIEAENSLRETRIKIQSLPDEIIKQVNESLSVGGTWYYRSSWLLEKNHQEYDSLSKWLKYASTEEGNGASISRYFSPKEIEEKGNKIADCFNEAFDIFFPIFNYIYNQNKYDNHTMQIQNFNVEARNLVYGAMTDSNFQIDNILLLRFLVSLVAKQFVILTGTSGSGKTKLAQAFSIWVTEKSDTENQNFTLIPVGADWTNNENILGYPNGLDENSYVSTPTLALIMRACANKNAPYFLILDEMNLSHVERYFADLLSAIESGEAIPLYEGAERSANGIPIPNKLYLPPNLFVIGTVNVDETTYMFSPKVLDRANVIEFRMAADALESFLESPGAPDLEALSGLGAEYGLSFVQKASQEDTTLPASVGDTFKKELLLFFTLLQDHNMEFGYRIAHESTRFIYYYYLLGGFEENDTEWFKSAMDAVIVQKILPKLHGSRSQLEGLLWALSWACGASRKDHDDPDFPGQIREAGKTQDEGTYGPEALWDTLAGVNAEKPYMAARYPLSYEKVMRMWRKLVRDQFVSFSEA